MKRVYLDVRAEGLHCKFGTVNEKPDKTATVTTKRGLVKLFKGLPDEVLTLCSSSLDFPDEYTKNKSVIKLCDWIRSER